MQAKAAKEVQVPNKVENKVIYSEKTIRTKTNTGWCLEEAESRTKKEEND